MATRIDSADRIEGEAELRLNEDRLRVAAAAGKIGINYDITETRSAESALRDSEQRYRNLFEQAGEGILLMTQEGKIVRVNTIFAAMHGYAVDELEGMHISALDTMGDKVFADRADHMVRLLRGERITFEVEHRHKDGRVFPLEVCTSIVEEHGTKMIIAFHRDITDRKRTATEMAEKLRELERWQKVTLGREARVQELKREADALRARLGEPPRYHDDVAAGLKPSQE